MAETMVRMGEFAFSATAGDMLVSLGLGSCIGLALLDRRATVAGLAHVVLPAAEGRDGAPGKFADTAVPALLEAVLGLGARRMRLEAVLVGGASMFSFGGNGLEVGQRNDAAVREELAKLRIPVLAAETGGSKGRTVRVHVEAGLVTSKAAGEAELELYPKALTTRAAA
jgi:chemotaxis protein CheD